MKITYTLEYHKPSKKWVVFKNIEGDQSCGFKGVFKGNRKECEEWIRQKIKYSMN